MEKIQSLKNILAEQPQLANEKRNKPAVHASFKAQGADSFVRQPSLDEQRMRAMEQREKEVKKQKRRQNISWAAGIFTAVAFGLMLVLNWKSMKGNPADESLIKSIKESIAIKEPIN